ncbi:hypothetical protein ACP70R_028135 [Stipagrostis hirtigluma subsp. patula]
MTGGRSLNVSAAMMLFLVLLGFLTTSAHCARVPDLAGGSKEAEAVAPGDSGQPPSVCYQKLCGGAPCFCCRGETPAAFCRHTEDECVSHCHPQSPLPYRLQRQRSNGGYNDAMPQAERH